MEMLLIDQDARDPRHIMVIHEVHQMFAPIDTQLFRSVLAVQRVRDLKQVHAVETGEDSFITLIICTAVEHLVVDDQIVVSKEDLSDQSEPGFDLIAEPAQTSHKIVVQGVGNIQAESVDPELLDPHFYALQEIIHYSGILEVQFYKFIMSLPAFVPEAVIIAAVAVTLLLQDVLECPETSSDMIEHSIQHDLYIVIVKRLADFPEVFVRAQTAVNLFEISCVVSVIV